jgi:4-amino-4-deoxy-L-arabinose transferase-like glycosyltransferase
MSASITLPVAASSSASLKPRGAIALLIVFALIWFSNLEYRRLIHPDEGRYAEIPREMVVTGDWVTPRLNGIKYFEKPALQYWLTAAAYEAFGIHPWTARLWPALSGFLGVLFVGYVGLRLGGPTLGLYASAVLGGCAWYVLNTHVLTLDAGLTFWMSCGLGALLIAQRADASPGETRAWMLVAWASLALAVLSKGLIGIVLPGGALVLYTLLTRDWVLWRRLHLVPGIALFLAIAAPWFVVVSLRNSEFFNFFFIHEHFARFLTNEHHREGAWWYFIPIFLVGLLPWVAVFGWTVRRMWSDAVADRNGFCWQRLALVWAAFIFVFFSMSGSKLPSYILPMFPPLALTIAWQLAITREPTLVRLTLPLVVIMAAITLVVLFGFDKIAPRFADARQPLPPLLAYGTWIKTACVVALGGGIAGLALLRAARRTPAILVVAMTALIAEMIVLTGHDELADSRSTEPILSRIAREQGPLRPDVPFYTIKMYDQTLPYYLGRTVTQVEHPDELAMGIASEPGKAIATLAEWRKLWEDGNQAYAIMQPDEYDQLQAAGTPMRVIARDPRRIIVSRR